MLINPQCFSKILIKQRYFVNFHFFSVLFSLGSSSTYHSTIILMPVQVMNHWDSGEEESGGIHSLNVGL